MVAALRGKVPCSQSFPCQIRRFALRLSEMQKLLWQKTANPGGFCLIHSYGHYGKCTGNKLENLQENLCPVLEVEFIFVRQNRESSLANRGTNVRSLGERETQNYYLAKSLNKQITFIFSLVADGATYVLNQNKIRSNKISVRYSVSTDQVLDKIY